MLIFFGFFLWIWLLITVFIDIFRSHDLSGLGKALWLLFILVIPLFGVLGYLIVRGQKMQEHAAQASRDQEEQFRQYVRGAAATPSSAEEVSKLTDLHNRGVLTDEEFDREKARVLSS